MAHARRQLRSGTVILGSVGLLAAALTACSSDDDPDKRCVDPDSYNASKGYKIVTDKNCTSGKAVVHGDWYYGGDKTGSWVDNGSFTRPRTGGYGSSGYGSGGVKRGGFGGGRAKAGG